MAQANWSTWLEAGTSFSDLTVSSNTDGRLEVFGVRPNRELEHLAERTPNGDWTGWRQLGTERDLPLAVGRNLDGRLEVFCKGGTGELWHVWQKSAGGEWANWNTLPQPTNAKGNASSTVDFKHLSIVLRVGGALELFVLSDAGSVLHIWQQRGGVAGWSDWSSLGAPDGVQLNQIEATKNQDGHLELFALASDGALWHCWDQTTNPLDDAKWSGWKSLGSPANVQLGSSDAHRIGIGQNEGGWLELFVGGSDNALWHIWQTRQAGTGWSEWASLGSPVNASFAVAPEVTQTRDGRLHVFSSSGGEVLQISQTVANNGWTDWTSLGTPARESIVHLRAGRHEDGRLELFAQTASEVWRLPQSNAASTADRRKWFEDLVARVAPIVYLHPDEPYAPSSIELYLGMTKYVDAGGTEHPHLREEDLLSAGPAPGSGGYLKYEWNGNAKKPGIERGDLDAAVAYSHVIPAADWSGGYDIQYWFFSPFNGAGIGKIRVKMIVKNVDVYLDLEPAGDHQGDLEMITVRVDREGNIYNVFCSVHDYGKWYGPASKPDSSDGYTLENGHPVIYSALNGHPSFTATGDFNTLKDGKAVGFDSIEGGIGSLSGAALNKIGSLLPEQSRGAEFGTVQSVRHFSIPNPVDVWDDAKKEAEKAAHKAKKAAEEAARKAKEAAEKAGEGIKGAAEDVKDALKGLLDGINASGHLVNRTARGKRWETYRPGKHQLVALDVPGMEDTVVSPWWLNFYGRIGYVNPPVNKDIAQSAGDNLKDQLMSSVSGLPGAAVEAVVQLTGGEIMGAIGTLEGYDGPIAMKAKSSWLISDS